MNLTTVTTPHRVYAVVTLADEDTPGGPGDLSHRLRAAFAEGVDTLLVDLSGLQRLSSDTVSALLRARREAAARGGRVVLRTPNRRSAALIARTELGRVFEVDTDPVRPSPWRHP